MVDFETFPPPTTHICGMTVQTHESMTQSTCARLLLYKTAKKKTYCARTPTTLVNESHFSVSCTLDRQQLNLKAANVSHVMGIAAQIEHIRYKPHASFTFHTSTRKSYHSQVSLEEDDEEMVDDQVQSCFKNHAFDYTDPHKPTTRKRPDDITYGKAPKRGGTGVRVKGSFKLNEERILDEHRVGIRSKLRDYDV